MRIVIDLQGAQSSGSRNRGIGRYSTALALEMCRIRENHEILLALNGAFAESVDDIRKQFAGLIPAESIRVFHPLPDVHSLNDEREAQREASAMAWEAFLASLEPDVVHVSSLFEGLSDDAVTSVGAYGYGRHLTVVTLYDLIPLINQERYLSNPVIDRWYRRKIDDIRRADLLLSISESSRQEGLTHLHFTDDQIVNISTAADPQFRPKTLSEKESENLKTKHGINRPFIMYTGGIDHRKNIEGLIEAYAILPADLRAKYALAVVCSCHEADRTRLLKLASEAGLGPHDVVMTGFVAEDDLIGLYSICSLFVFPSWHEGFGLPALEAMWCGAPVIGSNRSSLPEVIGWDDAMFNPLDKLEIASKIEQALTDSAFTEALLQHCKQQCRKFSWENSARTALTAIEQLWSEANRGREYNFPTEKPRLAYVSPIPPARSGIADYSAELIPELSRYYELDLIIPDDFDISKIDRGLIQHVGSVLTSAQFSVEHEHYDRVLYHFGNSDHHTHMFSLLAEIPGVVVLHDFFLSGILSYRQQHFKEEHVWSRALYYSHGYKALAAMAAPGGIEQAMWTYPSNREILDGADGIIVHSANSLRLASQWVGEGCLNRFTVIPHLRVPEVDTDANAARLRLGFGLNDIVICTFGIMGPTKQNRAILDAWLKSRASDKPNVHLIFVGQKDSGAYGAGIDGVIEASGKADRIRITGWTEMPQFRDYLRSADIAIQLRTLSRGETSGTVLDCMNFGVPVILNANGSLADLPQDCVKMLKDDFAQDELVAAIDELVDNHKQRETLGIRGRRLIETAHDPANCASLYRSAIESFALKTKSKPERVAVNIRRKHGRALSDLDREQLAERLDWNAAETNVDRRTLISIPAQSLRLAQGWRDQPLAKVLKALILADSSPRIEPIYWSQDVGTFRFARHLILDLFQLPSDLLEDDVVDFRIGDTLVDLIEADRSLEHKDGLSNSLRRVTMSYHPFSLDGIGAKKLPHSNIEYLVSALRQAGWHLT